MDEADVGAVQVGQKGSSRSTPFRAARFPRRSPRSISRRTTLRSPSTTSSNAASATSTGVVTYETVLEVDNSDLVLRPGMTATAEIVTTSIEDAVLIPNAALRFTPARRQGMPGAAARGQSAAQQRPSSALMPQMAAPRFRGSAKASRAGDGAWAAPGSSKTASRRWSCAPGATDGRVTQVLEIGPGAEHDAQRRHGETMSATSRRSSASSSRARRSSSTQRRANDRHARLATTGDRAVAGHQVVRRTERARCERCAASTCDQCAASSSR